MTSAQGGSHKTCAQKQGSSTGGRHRVQGRRRAIQVLKETAINAAGIVLQEPLKRVATAICTAGTRGSFMPPQGA